MDAAAAHDEAPSFCRTELWHCVCYPIGIHNSEQGLKTNADPWPCGIADISGHAPFSTAALAKLQLAAEAAHRCREASATAGCLQQ